MGTRSLSLLVLCAIGVCLSVSACSSASGGGGKKSDAAGSDGLITAADAADGGTSGGGSDVVGAEVLTQDAMESPADTAGGTAGDAAASADFGLPEGDDLTPAQDMGYMPDAIEPADVDPAPDTMTISDSGGSDAPAPIEATSGSDTQATPDGAAKSACCTPTDGSSGCPADKNVEACVCEQDPYCCETEWDSLCAGEVQTYGCGFCGASADASGGTETSKTDAGPPDTAGATNACCTTSQKPGCVDKVIEACVCKEDAYCCNTAWDSMCASEVGSQSCGTPCSSGTPDASGGSDGMPIYDASGAPPDAG